jgi:hypothetical protein
MPIAAGGAMAVAAALVLAHAIGADACADKQKIAAGTFGRAAR